MDNLTKAAGNVLARANKNKANGAAEFDPLTIFTIIGVLVNLVRLWLDCKKYHESPLKLGLFARVYLKNRIGVLLQAEMKKQGQKLGDFNELREAIYEEFLVSSEDLMNNVVSEVKNVVK